MKAKLYNQQAEVIGDVELPDRLFGQPMNKDLVYQVVRVMRANQSKPFAHTKGRGEVRGGGKKPWPQKGTGRARHGSIRSPLWKGGGVTHGPTKERVFARKINKKMRQKAIAAVLSEKARRGEIRVLENLELDDAKTKRAQEVLDRFLKQNKKRETALVLLPSAQETILRATRNLPNIKVMPAPSANVLDLLNRRFVILPRESVDALEKTFRHAR